MWNAYRNTGRIAALATLLTLFGACGDAAGRPRPAPPVEPARMLSAGDLRKSGVIDFDISCQEGVAQDFEVAVALLHSFFYDEARRRFEAIAERDPDCAMAWWGIAMTWYHPLWAPPTREERVLGLTAALRAQNMGAKTELERGFIDAIASYFTTNAPPAPESGPAVDCSCCGPRAQSARARAFHAGLEALHERFPDHVEVSVFYALSMLGTVESTDKTYARPRAAAALLEPLFEANPDHPGIAHYIIHAYDYPELADRALAAARKYDDIAPWVPHALHMPTHIYTRLGMWQDSISGNIASSEAARDHATRHYDGGATMDDLHAMDYLMYAYMQTAQDGSAQRVLEDLARIDRVVPGNGFASAYAAAAIPARFALERGDWKAAAALELPLPDFLVKYPMAVAHVEFARAVGAARTGDTKAARQAVQRLAKLRDALEGSRFDWWTDQVEIQRLAAAGWLAHAEGRRAEAERLMRRAAKMEDAAGTHPVSPGQILPAREQLADLLLASGAAAAAFAEYERSLLAFPRRFRSHAGAITAAREVGDGEAAARHGRILLTIAGESRERRDVLDGARKVAAGE